MFFPFRKETDLNNTPSGTYVEKLSFPDVIRIVNRNKAICEPYGNSVDEAFIQFSSNPSGLDPEDE